MFQSPSAAVQRFLGWLVSAFMPVILALGAIWIVLNPWFVEFEYRTPNFPADRYGFTQQERVQYAHVAMEYLKNDADISFLGDLRFPAGQQTPLESCINMDDCTRFYNDRELKHMLDVKIVLQACMWVLGILLLAQVALGIWAWRAGWLPVYRQAVGRGAWGTIGLIAAILLAVVVAFVPFFTFFHKIFFEGDSWMFLWSDTLIRLFPQRFWQDTFLMVGGITILTGLLLGQWLAPLRRKQARK